MPPGRPPASGLNARRLEGLEKRSSSSKAQLVLSIADDMSATFTSIAQHAQTGMLTARHTEPLDQVIRIIRDTEVSQRHRLERQNRRLRLERQWMRREFRKVVQSAEQVSRAWETRVSVLQRSLRDLRDEVARVKARCEQPHAWIENGKNMADGAKELDSCEVKGDEAEPLTDVANDE